ncbi:amine sulfotransferase-like [Brachionichthys hirsutus]|uniref:amine sulfotransferase-like n=1 Tax=Brachionichthys hirsutus TaxID=412623 RepID=UPI003604F6B1
MERISKYLGRYKNYIFPMGFTSAEIIDSLQSFEIRGSDVFLVTYPKSGTIWTQQIIISIYEFDGGLSKYPTNMGKMPWLEYIDNRENYHLRPSPRLFACHLTPEFMPPGLEDKKPKIIYVIRNPKDIIVSYYHFCQIYNFLDTPESLEDFFEDFMKGKVGSASWFDHVKKWKSKSDQYDILYLTYEDMIVDLKTAVIKICTFLGKNLSEADVEKVVEKSTFKNMKEDPKANYKFLTSVKGDFIRKGQIGDWKNYLTVAQSERVDQLLQEKLRDSSLKFIWE